MSLARIEIEEHRPGHWVAEVEAGYPACRRERVTGGDIVEIVTKVGEAYERLAGRPNLAVPLAEPLAPTSAVAAAWNTEPAKRRPGWPAVERPTREQVQQARSIGIKAKGSWSMTRFASELAKVAGVDPPV